MNYLRLLPDDLLVETSKYTADHWIVIVQFIKQHMNKTLVVFYNFKYYVQIESDWLYEEMVNFNGFMPNTLTMIMYDDKKDNSSYYYSDTCEFITSRGYKIKCYKRNSYGTPSKVFVVIQFQNKTPSKITSLKYVFDG